jgi:hypothetical protein
MRLARLEDQGPRTSDSIAMQHLINNDGLCHDMGTKDQLISNCSAAKHYKYSNVFKHEDRGSKDQCFQCYIKL